jgi:hypothetical protein
MRVNELGSAVEYIGPTWNGDGFLEERANELWKRLPESLRTIAIEEIKRGNTPKTILENKEQNIILLSFHGGPSTRRQNDQTLRIHTVHQYGNYCYDGTMATYEDIQTGCFLAFDDPQYEEPSL